MKQLRLVLVASASGLLLSACGGSSSGSSAAVQGLTPPAQLSVVEPANVAAPPSLLAPAAVPVGSFPPTAEYFADETKVYVYDPAIEPLQQVNEILCFLAQTAADELVNEGPYLAQIDIASCEQGQNQNAAGSTTGQSSSSNASSFQIWTIDSRRANNTSPQSVHLWILEDEDPSDPSTIFVDMTVRSGVDAGNAFGDFSLDYASVDGIATTPANPDGIGTLATVPNPTEGELGFELFESRGHINQPHVPGEESRQSLARVETVEDETQGWARVMTSERFNYGSGDSGILSDEHVVAYDQTHFLRSTNGSPAAAYFRDQVTENVWSYGLYHADGPEVGDRVDRDAGFGFRTEGDEYGWIDYYGSWLPSGVSLAHGDPVTRDVFGEVTEEIPYTVFKAPGRLIRFSKQTLDLVDIGGQVFEWWSFDPMSGTSTIYQVQYFPGTGTWEQVATLDPETYEVTPLNPTVVINTAAEGYLDLWSNSLQGHVAYLHGETSITYYSREFVDGADPFFAGGAPSLDLQGFVSCLKSGITTSEAEAGSVYLPDAPDVSTPHLFEFHAADLTLYHDTDGLGALAAVGLASGHAPTAGPHMWGMSTGPLVTAAAAAGLVDVYDVWNVDEFYMYETGHNEWNQYFGLIDQLGAFVDFPPPLYFTYEHATANDRNGDSTYDGQTFALEYTSFGSLWGFPFEGVDLDGDGTDDRFYPAVSLADGTLLVDADGVEYVVKALEVEQTLDEDVSYAGSLDLTPASALPLPDGSDYTIPAIGPAPVVPDPPRVISGEVVTSP